MTWWKILSLVVLAGCVSVTHQQHIVTEVKGKSELDNFLKGKIAIVLYYATWCPHCKRLMPAFDHGAIEAHKDVDAQLVHFAKVDCSNKPVNGLLCAKEHIRGYPTVFPYHNGKRQREIFLMKAEHYHHFAQLLQKGKVPQFDDMHEKEESKKCWLKDEAKWKKKMEE